MLRRRLVPALFASVVALAGCAESDPDLTVSPSQPAGAPAESARIPVVASTDVYGDIARQIGGPRVEVTSIISGDAQDPHSYEATARDELAVSRAQVVIVNGGHYDEFMSRLLSAARGERVVLDAVEIAANSSDDASPSATPPNEEHAADEHAEDEHGDDEHGQDEHAEDEHADDGHAEDGHAEDGHAEDEHAEDGHGHDHSSGENEHVWYDLEAIDALADRFADALSEVAPDSRSEFERNAEEFRSAIDALQQKQAEIRAAHAGAQVAVTEVVAGWLVEACGLENRTPAAFSEAIEEGTDVPVRVLQETLALMADDAVRVLIYNEQTSGPQTDQVLRAAEDADLPIVHVRETLPAGSHYLEWMDNTINALRDALA